MTAPLPAEVDRSRAPAPGPSRPCAFPAFSYDRLASGLGLWTLHVPDRGLVSLTLLLPGGSEFDPPERAGLASFTAALRGDGTRKRNALEFAAAAENLGTSVTSSCGWQMSALGVTVGAADVDGGLELIAEAALEPAFAPEEIDRRRRRRLAEIERRRSDPAAIAGAAFAAAVYGATPYGRPRIGNRSTTEALTRDEITALHGRALAARSSHLIAVGELGGGPLREAIEDTLEFQSGEHDKAFEAEPPDLEAAAAECRRIVVVDRPEAVQTELRLGHAGPPRSHPDRVPLQVANSILGGKFTSRLNLSLREKHGYTYGVSSGFSFRRGPGPFVVSTAVATEATGDACRRTLDELERMRAEPPSTAELEDAREYMVGVFPYTLQTIQGLAARLQTLATFDLDHDEYERWPELVRATRRNDVLEVSRRHIHADRMTVTAVGPAAELVPQLDSLGPVEVQVND